MESREKRAWLHVEGALGDLVDAGGNAEAMERLGRERLENEEIESSLKEIGRKFVFAVTHIDNL